MKATVQQNKIDQRSIITGILIGATILVLDMQLPLGVADGVLYVALVLIGLRSRCKEYILWSAVCGTFLILIGFYLSPLEGELWNLNFW